MSLIALEEHYAWDPASAGNVVATWLKSNNDVAYKRLYDRGPLRLEQMDAAGIDFQILSLFDPGVQDETDVASAIDLARRANDDLAETVRENPDRFGGFATLATQDPDAAAAGLFDKFPRLQMIIGHLGEMLPFAAYRIDRYYGLGGTGSKDRLQRLPSEYLRSNFHVTTSGNFCPPAFACTLEVLGADRVMFSVDYPMDDNRAGADFLASYPMDDATHRKVSSENAIRLFGERIPSALGG